MARNEIDMTNGPLLGKILLFSLPLMASSILQLLFNAADIIVVGRYSGSEALAAVGSNTALITLITNLFIGLSIGANVVLAKYIGAKKHEQARQTVHTSIAIAILGGLFLAVFGFAFSRTFLVWMGSPKEVLPLAAIYLKIYFLGMPAVMVYNFGAAILRAIGDTRRPLVFLFVSGVINIVLNLFFVIVLNMSVVGVALATVLSQCVSAVLVLYCMCADSGFVHLDFRMLSVDRARMIEIIKVGVPAGLQGMVFSISNVLIQSSVNSFGAIAVAGNTAASNIEGFIYMSMNSFYQSCVSFTGQNYGAKKPERILRVLFLCEMCGMVTGIVLGWPAFVFGRHLLSIYSSDPAVIEYGMRRVAIICTTYALCEIMDVPVGTLRGMGYGILPMTISLIGACLFRVIWIFTVFTWYRSPETLYISYPITWIITAIAQLVAVAYVWNKKEKAYLESK